MQNNNSQNAKLLEIAGRIRDMREISGYSVEEMAALVKVSAEEFSKYETGTVDFPFSFLHGCAQAFGIDVTELMTGSAPKLRSYTVTRSGQGRVVDNAHGMTYFSLASSFRNRKRC